MRAKPEELIDLRRLLPDPEAVRLVPRGVAMRFLLAPLSAGEGTIRLAMRDPSDLEALDYVEMITGRHPSGVAAAEPQIRELIQRLYGTSTGGSELEATVAEAVRQSREKADGTEMPTVRLVDQILAEAVGTRATDVHIQPEEDEVAVRFRVDGILRTGFRLPVEVLSPVLTRLKVLAALDISERRLPQDGQIELVIGDRPIDVRVSSFPTIHGESIVLRILDHSRILLGFEDLGFAPEDVARLDRLLHRPSGILLVTGPTGSGKTTTLYAALRTIDTERLNVMTLEDPVEYRLAGIRQGQISERAGFTFAAGLRALLRQDPDVLLVGEIRDRETAEIALRAALTGHLVLSTLHTNSAAGTITRLREMGLDDFLIASTLAGVLAQRLVRKTCRHCAAHAAPTASERRFLGLGDDDPAALARGSGCAACGDTGYSERFAIYEVLEVTPSLARRIGDGDPESALQEEACTSGMVSFKVQGAQRVLQGWTTPEELARVAF